ncbi:MAG: hypothetical protein RBR65_06495, partial [Aliarcobacter sp.]|nr:hypothetical protein [Aliarcobacter sp.]
MRNLILIVLVFLIIIYSLSYNLINANKKIDSYFEINSQIIQITQINREIYQFSLENSKYNNYDYIKDSINSMKKHLINIMDTNKYPLIKNTEFYSKSLQINNLILEEIEIIEKLKSYNAIFNNSIRNIKILKSKLHNSNKYDSIYNRALTLHYEDNLDIEALENEFNKYTAENEIENMFLSHVKIISEYFIKKQLAKQRIDDLSLFDELETLYNLDR